MNRSEKIFFGMSCLVAAGLLFAASANAPLTRRSVTLPVASSSAKEPVRTIAAIKIAQPAAAPLQVMLRPEQKRKVTTMVYYSKTIIRDDADMALEEERQAQRDAEQANLDAVQAKKDAEMAEQDAKQAVRDRLQAEIDKQQAEKDHWQSEQDRLRSEKVKHNAERQTP